MTVTGRAVGAGALQRDPDGTVRSRAQVTDDRVRRDGRPVDGRHHDQAVVGLGEAVSPTVIIVVVESVDVVAEHGVGVAREQHEIK